MSLIVPGLTVFFTVILAAVPWGLPDDATFVLPLVAVMTVFCWRAIPGANLPAIIAVVFGLLLDVTSGGPLGFWALLALAAASAGTRAQPFASRSDWTPLWLVWTGLAATLAGSGWLIASLYYFRWIDWWPIALGAVASVILFPLIWRLILRLYGNAYPQSDFVGRGAI
jgi:rod shape-determining protein MreD